MGYMIVSRNNMGGLRLRVSDCTRALQFVMLAGIIPRAVLTNLEVVYDLPPFVWQILRPVGRAHRRE
jgi:hypothetical protein